ncbi:MAG: CotH kinase family protein [Flavobacteriaceae bacterium]|nr:CotH kinase family protein [Flavobacteriaceae bacterium]
MHKLYFVILILLVVLPANAQFQAFQESSEEVIEERTKYTKKFIHKNKTSSLKKSSAPLHYLTSNGRWEDLDYEIVQNQQFYQFPKQAPTHQLNGDKLSYSIHNGQNQIGFGEPKMVFLNENFQEIKQAKFSANKRIEVAQKHLQVVDETQPLQLDYDFYSKAIKTNILINEATFIPQESHQLVIFTPIEIPSGWSVRLQEMDKFTEVLFVNPSGKTEFKLSPTVISDAVDINKKIRHEFEVEVAKYELIENANGFQIKTIIDGAWLTHQNRIFPIAIDPVVSITDNTEVGSCFSPNFQTSTLSIDVPEDQEVFFTNIEYDIVAVSGSQAWMSDQRSYVSSINGETNILNGVGDTAGTETYELLGTSIANGTSAGTIDFTFHNGRVWGGNGCNTTFQIMNRRDIEVFYGTVEFADGPVYINEYSFANRGNITGNHVGQHFTDEFGRTESWIELYNADPDFFYDLSGHYLSNDENNPLKWQIESAFIPPNSKVIIWDSRRDISSGMVLHSDFNFRQLREDAIVLSDADGNLIESLVIDKTQHNHSRGRLIDGGDDWGIFTLPTPGNPNENGVIAYTSTPLFDVEAGEYSTSVNVSLSTENEDEEIRYTTDGSTPTENSTVYTSPIQIDETTVIRARCFNDDPMIIPGFIETNTYLINENHSLPVFSFAGDQDMLTLFNGNDQLRPLGHFEYFDEDGLFIDENFGDFNKHGNDSWNYAQRGVDFISRDEFGYNRRLDHKFFKTSDRTRFRRLMVKAAANDNYPFEEGGAHIRDSYIQTLSQLAHLDLDERSSTNVIVYVNGQYWGVYDLRERVDDNNYTDEYFNQNYTFRDSDIYLQFLKTWGGTEAHFGNQPAINDWQNLVNFVLNNDMGNETNYQQVEQELNMQSLIDHFVLNSYIVSRDWLNYNTGWWRGLDPNGEAQKWRYIVWDMEAALGHFTNYTGIPNDSATAPPCQVENITVGNGHAQILNKLISENEEIEERYVNRYISLINTHFKYENAEAVLDSMVNNIAPEMPRQIERWGGNLTTWEDNVQAIRDFLQTRSSSLINGLINCYDLTGPFEANLNVVPSTGGTIQLNDENLSNFPFEATLFGEINTYLRAEANPGYSFSHWEVDGVVVSPDLNAEEISFMVSEDSEFTAHFENTNLGDYDLLYYWHFNDLETPEDITEVATDFSYQEDSVSLMTYTETGNRDMDIYNTGSDINLFLGEPAGKAIRVRNLSDHRSLIFDLPSLDYQDLVFGYAVHRSGQGMLQNIISYTIDGENYIQEGLNESVFDIIEAYQFIEIDFSEITGVNHNENFKIKIEFEGNTLQTNGNNRFDNIALKGMPLEDMSVINEKIQEFQIYPNPFKNHVHIKSHYPMKSIELIDINGRRIQQHQLNNHNTYSLTNLEGLANGVYIIRIHTTKGYSTHQLIH